MKKIFSNSKYFIAVVIIGAASIAGCGKSTIDAVTTTISEASSDSHSSSNLSDVLLMIKYKDNLYYSVGQQISKEEFDNKKGIFLGTTSTVQADDVNAINNVFENELTSLPNLSSNIASAVNVYYVKGDVDEKQLIAEIDNHTYEIFEK